MLTRIIPKFKNTSRLSKSIKTTAVLFPLNERQVCKSFLDPNIKERLSSLLTQLAPEKRYGLLCNLITDLNKDNLLDKYTYSINYDLYAILNTLTESEREAFYTFLLKNSIFQKRLSRPSAFSKIEEKAYIKHFTSRLGEIFDRNPLFWTAFHAEHIEEMFNIIGKEKIIQQYSHWEIFHKTLLSMHDVEKINILSSLLGVQQIAGMIDNLEKYIITIKHFSHDKNLLIALHESLSTILPLFIEDASTDTLIKLLKCENILPDNIRENVFLPVKNRIKEIASAEDLKLMKESINACEILGVDKLMELMRHHPTSTRNIIASLDAAQGQSLIQAAKEKRKDLMDSALFYTSLIEDLTAQNLRMKKPSFYENKVWYREYKSATVNTVRKLFFQPETKNTMETIKAENEKNSLHSLNRS